MQQSSRKSALRQTLVEAQAALVGLLDRVGADEWSRIGPYEGWTVRDLLAHLSTAERGFVPTLRRIAAGEGGVPQDFDPNRWNAGQLRRQTETSTQELREKLEEAHREMLAFLDEIDDAALDQRGRVGSGDDGTLADGVRLVARHKAEHTADLRAALQG